MVSLDGLRALATLRRLGTVGATAKKLGFTPSAVSQQLARLQSEMHAELLQRRGRLLELTPAGLIMADVAEEMLSHWESGIGEVESLQGSMSGSVAIAAFPTAARGLLPTVISILAENQPELHVKVVETRSHETLEMLRHGDVDVAVSHDWLEMPLQSPQGIISSVIGEDTADIVIAVRDPLAERPQISLRDLRNKTWVLEYNSVSYDLISNAFERHGYTLRVAYSVREIDAQLEFIKRNLAIGLVPRMGRSPLPPSTRALVSPLNATRRVYSSIRSTSRNRPSIVAVQRALHAGMKVATRDTTNHTPD